MLTNEEIAEFFAAAEARIEGNRNLRDPPDRGP